MLKIGVLVSGGGTNLQAILDAIDAGEITNAKVDIVISNNASAYALERAMFPINLCRTKFISRFTFPSVSLSKSSAFINLSIPYSTFPYLIPFSFMYPTNAFSCSLVPIA